MPSLSHNAETRLFKRPHGTLMRDARDRHRLPPQYDFPLLGAIAEFFRHGEVLVNGIADIVESLVFSPTLRGTACEGPAPTR